MSVFMKEDRLVTCPSRVYINRLCLWIIIRCHILYIRFGIKIDDLGFRLYPRFSKYLRNLAADSFRFCCTPTGSPEEGPKLSRSVMVWTAVSSEFNLWVTSADFI